ncbi:MAG: alpha/beta hydrolase [Bacteroidales bacterium]|nr:alpha/beta hydrolase [Bacteroidales bacterium]
MRSGILLLFSIIFVSFSPLYAQSSKPVFTPHHTGYITTSDGLKLWVKESGTGPVCIFIHGGPGAWSKSFEDMGGSNLEKHLTMVYFDQRGSGRSEGASDNDYSLERMLKDINEVREKLHVNQVYLLAHSFGGILATNYALKYPEHVKGLILANCTLNLKSSIRSQIGYINHLLGTHFEAQTDAALIPTMMEALKALKAKGLDYKRLSDNKQNVEKLHRIDASNPSQYIFSRKALMMKQYQQNFSKITPEVKCPVLVITGKKDHAVGINQYKSFKFPHEKIVKIDGGHLLYYEHNPQFVRTVFSFVDKTSLHN